MNYTYLHRTPLDVSGSLAKGLEPLPFSRGLFRLQASSGSFESSVLNPPGSFSDLVGSWNAELAPQARLKMQAQVLSGGKWSPWFTLGEAQGGEFRSPPSQENHFGLVDMDTLKLKRPAQAFRYRLIFFSDRGQATLRSVAIAVSDGQVQEPPAPFFRGPWVRELKLRGRSQMEEQEEFKRDICSPASLAMVLDYWGARRETRDIAFAVQDKASKRFGVWPYNTAVAGNLGLDAFVARLESLQDIEEEIAHGRPVVVSVFFGPGELTGAPIHKTKGHLLVVVGFTEDGDVIVRDPAAKTSRETRRVYRRGEFDRAWRVKKLGLAYLISKPMERAFVVGVASADLRKSPQDKGELLTQLVYGEKTSVISARGKWVRVRAEEQLYRARRRWQGYEGWINARSLRSEVAAHPNVVVVSRQAVLRFGKESLTVSVGTRLRRISQNSDVSLVRLLDGKPAEIASRDLAMSGVSPELGRERILETAQLFLGLRYLWGGRSGVQADPAGGVDCSGLVSLAYRAAGLDVPRDAQDQKLKSRSVDRKDLKPGDLIFLTENARSSKITHVMLYAGGEDIIESRQTGERALRTTFSERFGLPLERHRAGSLVDDLSMKTPGKRRIFFGAYL